MQAPHEREDLDYTTWLRAGIPLGEVAARMGHSVETLVSTYVGAVNGGDAIANERIDAILAGSSSTSLTGRTIG